MAFIHETESWSITLFHAPQLGLPLPAAQEQAQQFMGMFRRLRLTFIFLHLYPNFHSNRAPRQLTAFSVLSSPQPCAVAWAEGMQLTPMVTGEFPWQKRVFRLDHICSLAASLVAEGMKQIQIHFSPCSRNAKVPKPTTLNTGCSMLSV